MAKTDILYILKQDLLKFIDPGTLEEWTDGKKAIGSTPAVPGDDTIWQKNITNASGLVKGYSQHWYDMDTEMRTIYEYDNNEAFDEGDRVASVADGNGNRTLYLCIQDAPAGTLLTNTDFFTQIDDRNETVVEMVCEIILYKVAGRKNPRQLPEQRRLNYEDVLNQLVKVQKGDLQFDITQRTIDEDDVNSDPGQSTAFGDFEDVTQDAY